MRNVDGTYRNVPHLMIIAKVLHRTYRNVDGTYRNVPHFMIIAKGLHGTYRNVLLQTMILII